jgi:hypothetical protein
VAHRIEHAWGGVVDLANCTVIDHHRIVYPEIEDIVLPESIATELAKIGHGKYIRIRSIRHAVSPCGKYPGGIDMAADDLHYPMGTGSGNDQLAFQHGSLGFLAPALKAGPRKDYKE